MPSDRTPRETLEDPRELLGAGTGTALTQSLLRAEAHLGSLVGDAVRVGDERVARPELDHRLLQSNGRHDAEEVTPHR
jgi:hypothetical protein